MWGTPQKKAEATLKQALTQAPALEVARPRKSIPTLRPWKRGSSLGSVNSKVGTWAPACSLPKRFDPTALGQPASLPSKSCSFCNPDRRCFKTLFWGQTIFTKHQVKQLLNGRGHLWMSDQRTLIYQVVLMENPCLVISPCEVFNPATLFPTAEGSLPFLCCLETLDHWTKFWEGCQKILWPILRKSGTLMEAVLS